MREKGQCRKERGTSRFKQIRKILTRNQEPARTYANNHKNREKHAKPVVQRRKRKRQTKDKRTRASLKSVMRKRLDEGREIDAERADTRTHMKKKKEEKQRMSDPRKIA